MSESKWQIIFKEGVHYWNPKEYLSILSRKLSLWALIGATTSVQIDEGQSQQQANRQLRKATVFLKGRESFLSVIEKRYHSDNRVEYSMADQLKDSRKSELVMKIRIEQAQKGQNLVRVTIHSQQEDEKLTEVMKEIMKPGVYVWKKEYCWTGRNNQILYPYLAPSIILSEQHSLLLMVQQHSLTELPLYTSILRHMLPKHSNIHLIGPPSSLILALSITPSRDVHPLSFSEINQRKSNQKEGDHIDKREITQVRRMLYSVLHQQNILDVDLIEFLVQSTVNQEFIICFEEIIQVYYRILLHQQLPITHIRQAILSGFYTNLLPRNTFISPFTTLFNSIEFYHHHLHRQALKQITDHLQNDSFGDWTLEDLYNLRGIEYTWVGMDLDDSILRLFNRHTTPLLPLKAIISLTQLLTAPYQALIWQAQWGPYTVTYPHYRKQINLQRHQIIDAQLVFPSPHQLVKDQHFRNCYMGGFKGQIKTIGTPTPTINTDQVDVLKRLLKSLKNHAIDSIPKIKLIWKVLTSNNRVDLDINNAQSFSQIPILEKTFAINDAYKYWLANINHEVNQNFLVSINTQSLYKLIDIKSIPKDLSVIEKVVKDAITFTSLVKGEQDIREEIDRIIEFIQNIENPSYSQIKAVLSTVNALLTSINSPNVINHCKQLERLASTLKSYPLIFQVHCLKQQLISLLKSVKIINLKVNLPDQQRQSQRAHSSTFLRPTTELKQSTQTLTLISREVKAFKERFQALKRRVKKQAVCFEYRRLLLRVSCSLEKGLRGVKKDQKLAQIQQKFYQITPYLYQLQQAQSNSMLIQISCLDALPLPSQGHHEVHFVFNGNLRDPLQHILAYHHMQSSAKQSNCPITAVTACGVHAISAFLFVVGLPPNIIMQETISALQLIETNWVQPKQTPKIMEIYQEKRPYRNKSPSQHELYQLSSNIKIIERKYMNCSKLLTEMKALVPQVALIEPMQLIVDYDSVIPDSMVSQKETAIKEFLEEMIKEGNERKERQGLVRENQQMLSEKLNSNRVGVRFMIKLMYRETVKEENWLPIHCGKFRQLNLLTMHLTLLMNKYKIAPNITLQQFQQKYPFPSLNFPLINTTQLQLTVANAQSHPNSPLIHTIIAAMSSAVEYPTQPIYTPLLPKKLIEHHINMNNQHICPSFALEEYWSSEGIAPMSMHLLRPQSQENTIFVAFTPNLTPAPQTDPKNRKQNKATTKPMNEQAKIKALDVLGIWWNKPKKLLPALKKVVFDNLYNSPFLSYYSLLLKHAHHQQRPPLVIRETKLDQQQSQMLGECLKSQDGMMIAQFEHLSQAPTFQAKIIAQNTYPPALLRHQNKTLTAKSSLQIEAAQEIALELQWMQEGSLHKLELIIIMPKPLITFYIKIKPPYLSSECISTYPDWIKVKVQSQSRMDGCSQELTRTLQSLQINRTLSSIQPPPPYNPPPRSSLANSITRAINLAQLQIPTQDQPERQEATDRQVIGGQIDQLNEWEQYFQQEEKEEQPKSNCCCCGQ